MTYYLYIHPTSKIHTCTYMSGNCENEFRVHCDVPIYSPVLTFPLFTE